MIKNSHTQTGSAHVIIIATLIIALMGALGFIFWQNYTTKSVQTNTSVGTKQASEAKSDLNEGYVVLADWGIRFKTDDSLKTTTVVQYKKKEKGQEGREYYLVNTERSEKAAQAACPSLSDPTGLSLYRFTEKPSTNSEGQLLEAEGKLLNNTAINGYYYVLVTFGWMCPSGDENSRTTNAADIQSDDEALRSSLLTLQSAK
jgi:hypothetical protein